MYVQIVVGIEILQFFAIPANQADIALVKFQCCFLGVTNPMITAWEHGKLVDVFLIGCCPIFEDFQACLGNGNHFVDPSQDGIARFGGFQGIIDAARELRNWGECGVRRLVWMISCPYLRKATAFSARLASAWIRSNYVADGRISVKTENQIRDRPIQRNACHGFG